MLALQLLKKTQYFPALFSSKKLTYYSLYIHMLDQGFSLSIRILPLYWGACRATTETLCDSHLLVRTAETNFPANILSGLYGA